MNASIESILPFPRLRGKVPKADGGNSQGGPHPPSGHLVLATSMWLARRAASAANIGSPADVSPLRRGRESLLGVASFALGIFFALATMVYSNNAFAIDPLPFKDRAEEVRFQNLTKQLRCLVCQNQDLADSDADLAKDLRKQVYDMMKSGKSDDEIKDYLVARYNDFVLYDPPLKPGTWLLWFSPFAFVLIGVFVVARILRSRAQQTGGVRPADTESGDDW